MHDEEQRSGSAYDAPHALKLTPIPSDTEELPTVCQAQDQAVLPLLSLSPNSYEVGIDPLISWIRTKAQKRITNFLRTHN